MKFVFDSEHGYKHFGGRNGTIWQNSRNNVLRAAENYLRNKAADLLNMFQSRGGTKDSVGVGGYIVDEMKELRLPTKEKKNDFVIQVGLCMVEAAGGQELEVKYHLYPDDCKGRGYGIGETKTAANAARK
jgi:hypothetical protein